MCVAVSKGRQYVWLQCLIIIIIIIIIMTFIYPRLVFKVRACGARDY